MDVSKAARPKGEGTAIRSFVSSECEVYSKVCAVVAERKGRERRGFEHGTKRGTIKRSITAGGFVFCIANRAVTIDGEGNGGGEALSGLRPQKALADEHSHPVDVDRVWKVPLDSRYAGGADRDVRSAD